jgi:hypothetical protein
MIFFKRGEADWRVQVRAQLIPSTAVAVVDVPEPARPGESSCTATASRRKEPVVKVARTGTEQRGDAGEAEDQGSGAGRGLACVVLDAGR